MGSVSYPELVEEWDPVPVRWRLMAHHHATERLLQGQTPRRVARYLHQTLGMPQEDARAVGERVSAELALRIGLAL